MPNILDATMNQVEAIPLVTGSKNKQPRLTEALLLGEAAKLRPFARVARRRQRQRRHRPRPDGVGSHTWGRGEEKKKTRRVFEVGFEPTIFCV